MMIAKMCTTPDNEDPDANTQVMQQCGASMAEEVKKMIIKQNELTEVLHGLTHVLANLNIQNENGPNRMQASLSHTSVQDECR